MKRIIFETSLANGVGCYIPLEVEVPVALHPKSVSTLYDLSYDNGIDNIPEVSKNPQSKAITEDDVDELFQEIKMNAAMSKQKIKKQLDKYSDYAQLVACTTIPGGQNVFHILADGVSILSSS
jgi:hypothetical protein